MIDFDSLSLFVSHLIPFLLLRYLQLSASAGCLLVPLGSTRKALKYGTFHALLLAMRD